jgi:glutathione S-transferase
MKARLPPALKTLDRWIGELGGFVAGPHMTISDFIGFVELSNTVNFLNYDISAYKNVHQWYYAIHNNPVIVEIQVPTLAMASRFNRKLTLYGDRLS